MQLPVGLISLGQTKKIPAGMLLFQAGAPAQGFYYVTSGEIRLYKMDVSGKEIEVSRLMDGDIFGEVIVFAAKNFPVYAETIKNTQVLYFSKEIVDQAVRSKPEIAQFFLTLLANKCLILNQRIESLGLQSVRERLIQYLLGQCTGDGSCLLTLTMTKTDLAKQLGTISETLSRTFKQLQKEKLIVVQGKKIKILNCIALRKSLT